MGIENRDYYREEETESQKQARLDSLIDRKLKGKKFDADSWKAVAQLMAIVSVVSWLVWFVTPTVASYFIGITLQADGYYMETAGGGVELSAQSEATVLSWLFWLLMKTAKFIGSISGVLSLLAYGTVVVRGGESGGK